MAYRTYTTKAVVMSAYERTGSDMSVKLFTEDAGMVFARAVGVRDEKSKMRYALQPFSVARVTLVRGKAEWRLVGVEALENLFFSAVDRRARAQLLECFKLVARFVHGEERHTRLFHLFLEGVRSLCDVPSEDVLLVQRLRLLHELGYVSAEGEIEYLCHAPTLALATDALGARMSARVVARSIDAGLAASHL